MIGLDMPTIQRLRIGWSGFSGAPGLTTFYFADAALARNAIGIWCTGLSEILPAGVTLQPENTGDILDVFSGDLIGQWSSEVLAPAIGGNAAGYSAATGLHVNWESDTFFSGRRLRGRTFVVPISGAFYQNDGTLATGVQADMQVRSEALRTANAQNLRIYQRPRAATPSWTDVRGVTHPAKPRRDGGSAGVINSFTPDKVAVLRSRRD